MPSAGPLWVCSKMQTQRHVGGAKGGKRLKVRHKGGSFFPRNVYAVFGGVRLVERPILLQGGEILLFLLNKICLQIYRFGMFLLCKQVDIFYPNPHHHLHAFVWFPLPLEDLRLLAEAPCRTSAAPETMKRALQALLGFGVFVLQVSLMCVFVFSMCFPRVFGCFCWLLLGFIPSWFCELLNLLGICEIFRALRKRLFRDVACFSLV